MHEPFFFSANVDNDAVEHRREHPRTTAQCQKQRSEPDGFGRKDVVEVACRTRVRKHTRGSPRHRTGRPHTRSGAKRRRAPGRLCTASARASSPIDQPAVQTEGSEEGLPGRYADDVSQHAALALFGPRGKTNRGCCRGSASKRADTPATPGYPPPCRATRRRIRAAGAR